MAELPETGVDKCNPALGARPISTDELLSLQDTIRDHLLQAQQLIDSVMPNSMLAARLQHVLDDFAQLAGE